jgi:hypothetical protein
MVSRNVIGASFCCAYRAMSNVVNVGLHGARYRLLKTMQFDFAMIYRSYIEECCTRDGHSRKKVDEIREPR